MRPWFYLLGGVVVICMLPFVLVLVGMVIIGDNNIVILQNQGTVAVDLHIGLTDDPPQWQVHLPAQACALVQFHVRGDSALTTTVAGFATEQSGYYTRNMGSVDCFALPDGNCDLSALRCSSLILP